MKERAIREPTGHPRRTEADSGGTGSTDLQRLHHHFERIYVVSIERNADRRELLERDLEGLPLTYLPGVDGRELSEAEIGELYDDEAAKKTYGRSLSIGQIGCALSHRNIYRDIVDKGVERALILEDDALLCRGNVSEIDAVVGQLPEDWDFLYLFTNRAAETPGLWRKVDYLYPLLTRTGIRRYDMEKIRRTYSRRYSSQLRVAGQHWFALAYAVTRRTAEQMLRIQTPVRTVADDVTRMICAADDFKAFLSVPNIFVPRPDVDSTIWNRPARNSSGVDPLAVG